MIAILIIFAISIGPASVDTNPHKTRSGPIKFRCDSMQILSNPNRSICHTNVLVRRGDLLLCCDRFEGYADSQWGWTKFTCAGNIRAQRLNELIWSKQAHFNLKTSSLVLRGLPLIKRNTSYLTGTRITLNVDSNHAQISKPRGVITPSSLPSIAPQAHKNDTRVADLPEICPLPTRPGQ